MKVVFRTWNKCSGNDPKSNYLLKHKSSEVHRKCIERHAGYVQTKKHGNVPNLIDDQHKKLVSENRHYMKTLCSIFSSTKFGIART